MKLIMTIAWLGWASLCLSQSLEGTWQLTDEKTCFQSELGESETEKELKESMAASRNAIGKMLVFDGKGGVQESIKSQGKKKGTGVNNFKYQLAGNELQFLDKKSGVITQRYIIDELTYNTLRLHNVMRECETKIYTRAK